MTVATNYTIDNVNPMISYLPAGTWIEGQAAQDGSAKQYSNSTFTLTTTPNSFMSFSFNGTAIWVFGGKRGNHGKYSVSLDNANNDFNGFASPDVIPATLFSATSLSNGPHQISIKHTDTGAGPLFLDIDSITWTVETAKATTQTTAQDNNAAVFSYSPSDAWTSNGPIFSRLQSSGHETTTAKAQVTLNFAADGISLLGVIGPTNGPYSVQIDGGSTTTFNATKDALSDGKMVLFSANGLGQKNHTMVVTNVPDKSGQSLAINSVILQKLPVASGSKPGGDTNSGDGDIQKSKSPSTGVIVGIAVGAVLALCLAASLIFFIRRKQRRRKGGQPQGFVIDDEPKSARSPTANAITPFELSNIRGGAGAGSQRRRSGGSGLPPSPRSPQYSESAATARTMQNPWSELGSPTRHRYSVIPSDEASSSGGAPSVAPPPSSSAATTRTTAATTMPRSEKGGMNQSSHSLHVSNGSTSSQAPSAAPLVPGRLYEEGREQDLGPLPPSYVQATQPFDEHR